MEEELGPASLLVNSAGFVEPAGLLELTLDNWETTLATNLTGVFLCAREFVRRIKHRGGRVINIASTCGLSARPGWAAYAAAKAGVINFSHTLAEELRPYGISVYCVAPGRTATELRLRLAPDEDPTEIMQPQAVGRLVATLAGELGQYIDDQTIVIRKPVSS